MHVQRAGHHEGSFRFAPNFLFTSHLGLRSSEDNHCKWAASSSFSLGTDPHTSWPRGTGTLLRPPCRLQRGAARGEGCPLSSPTQAVRDPGPARPELPPQAWRPWPCRDSPAPFAGETGRSSPSPEPSLAVWPPWGRAGPHLTASPCGRPQALPSAPPPAQPPGPERSFSHL